ncbi:hypothetical protein WJX72_000894 [[Myrmecia] bisecta]|uniref:Endonuclease/exonuclease/phosphatase domain-containing protein n=1 Tax=[Myrmecia] bisecta TaxID=41462 RepID=A0AAW1R3N7_9CHLO
MQWNVLADGLAQNGNFIKVPKEVLLWGNRSPLLLAEILASQADIVCLQEVNHYEDFFEPQLRAHGFTGLFWPKACSPAEQYGYACDGCAIFFKQERLTLLGEPEGSTFRTREGSIGKQVMMHVRLRDNATGLHLLVATTHLKAKEGTANDQMRVSQVEQLVERLQSACDHTDSSSNGSRPTDASMAKPLVVLCGDFNTTPESGACQVLRRHGLGLQCLWDEPVSPSVPDSDGGASRPFTTWKYRPGGESQRIIDYIWWSADERMRPARRIRLFAMQPNRPLRPLALVPNMEQVLAAASAAGLPALQQPQGRSAFTAVPQTTQQQQALYPEIALFSQLGQLFPQTAELNPYQQAAAQLGFGLGLNQAATAQPAASRGRARSSDSKSSSAYASRHQAAEQRRRSRINERLDRLRQDPAMDQQTKLASS